MHATVLGFSRAIFYMADIGPESEHLEGDAVPEMAVEEATELHVASLSQWPARLEVMQLCDDLSLLDCSKQVTQKYIS